ncbi:MAG TPA: sporulation integral membrane protein YtvI [Bacillota bacterium]|jgi:sporulation integral membrane protein YtvI|nr:sporulation integral membrane protein YtvI [Bacillota bacterium]
MKMTDGQKTLLGALAIAVVLFLFFRYLLGLVLPFIIALIISGMIKPQVRWLEQNTKVGRGWATLFALLFFIFCLILILFWGTSSLYFQLQDLLRTLPRYEVNVTKLIEEWLRELAFFYNRLPEPLISSLQGLSAWLYGQVEAIARSLVNWAVRLPEFFLNLTVSFVAAFFITRDYDLIRRELLRFLPSSWRQPAWQVVRDVFAAIVGFIRSQLILMSISGLVCLVALWMLRVKYAFLLACLVALLDLLPLIGPSAFYLPWAAYHVGLGNYSFALSLVLTLIAGTVIRQIAEPRVVGSQIGLHPLATLVGIYLGFRLFGTFGLLLGPVLVITFKAIARGFLSPLFPKS